MKIIKDRSYLTRIFDIKDEEKAYTVTYTETYSGWEWLIEDNEFAQINQESQLGLKLISLCVDAMGIHN
jgi:hypothetical protein